MIVQRILIFAQLKSIPQICIRDCTYSCGYKADYATLTNVIMLHVILNVYSLKY